ncbi:MAG: hypothetical protein ACAH10_03950 [Methylophilaceae bacterium]
MATVLPFRNQNRQHKKWHDTRSLWLDAKRLVDDVQNALDQKMQSYLAGSGPLPAFEELQELHEISCFEADIRDELDALMFESIKTEAKLYLTTKI